MKAPQPAPGTSSRWRRILAFGRAHPGKSLLWVFTALFVSGFLLMDTLLAGPMQRWAERTMNANLKGYTVRIGSVRPHLWRFAFDLNDLVVTQNTHPTPAVANFRALQFSLQTGALLRFKLAGNLNIVRPALHIDLTQIQEEVHSHVSLKERGWQQAVEALFPFKFDQVKVQDGSVLYLSGGTASKPIQITQIAMNAQNVRNIAVSKDTFPSPVTMEGVLFDSGKLSFKGTADFMREPHAGAKGEIRLERVPLDRLSPLAEDYQLKTTGGFLSLQGSVESTPEAQMAHLTRVEFADLQVDYVTSQATKAVEKQHAKQAVKLADQVRNAPAIWLEVDALTLRNSRFGFENKGATPPYRVFISNLSLDLDHLSNQPGQVASGFHAHGAFMGSGTTTLKGRVRTSAKPVDVEVHLDVEDAKLTSLNGLLMAHAGVDVADGQFSLFSEIKVKNGTIEGYIKPLIKNLKIYDRQKDKGKRFGKRVEMHVLQFLANLFRNRDSKAVATVVRISGSTGGPDMNEWEVIRKLIGNGLSHAILPGFLAAPKTAVPDPPHPAPKPGK